MSWSLQELADATQGVISGELLGESQVRFDSISTDSRILKSGALYVAIKGSHFDGHDFIDQSVQQGAVALLISEPMPTVVPAVLVADTRVALGEFAAWHRRNMPLKQVIGITGTNGKTTTKSLLAHVLSKKAPTLATAGNLNNDFGVPRTLLQIEKEHEYAVIEMGANHPHEIAYLTKLVQPTIALITNASAAHLEGFGSLEGVIQTKGEIFLGLPQQGTCILNRDSSGFDAWWNQCAARGLKVKTFGESPLAEVRLMDYQQSEMGGSFTLLIQNHLEAFEIALMGRHNALNASAVVAICLTLGMTVPEIKSALASFSGLVGRLHKHALPNGCLLDDSYNANPESVKAGIQTLVELPGHACLCLGAMAELGENSVQAHEEVAAFAKAKGVKHLLLYGEATRPMLAVFGTGARWFDSHHILAKTVVEQLRAQQIQNVLVKGSRSSQMEQVSAEILHSL